MIQLLVTLRRIAQRYLRRINNVKFFSAAAIFSPTHLLMSTEFIKFSKDVLN